MILLRDHHFLGIKRAILALDLRHTLQSSHHLSKIIGPVDPRKILHTLALALIMSLRRDREIGKDLVEARHLTT